MKIEGRISILFSEDGLRIEVKDPNSTITFLMASLNKEQTCMAMSRLGQTECELELRSLDLVGKKHESKEFVFEIPESHYNLRAPTHMKCKAALLEQGLIEEWIPDNYYQSQNSFFKKDGKHYARTIIRRWV